MTGFYADTPIAAGDMPGWEEPTKDQWHAYRAAWLGWTLDAFDFTVFLLVMLPISQEFGVPLPAVTAMRVAMARKSLMPQLVRSMTLRHLQRSASKRKRRLRLVLSGMTAMVPRLWSRARR